MRVHGVENPETAGPVTNSLREEGASQSSTNPVGVVRDGHAVSPKSTQAAKPDEARDSSWPWLAVSAWTQANGIEGPIPILMNTNPVFEVRSSAGTIAFQIGTTSARFNSMTLMLGFEPKAFGGQVYLHALDVEKNLEPLLLAGCGIAHPKQLVVIDPGHGGENTGTRSLDGKLEKDYTLDWALRLQPLLETNGWTVLLTRTNDAAMTLPERVAFAEAAQADLFVSLHFNASGGGNHQSGVETYCLTPQGMPSTLIRDYGDDPDAIYPNNAFDTENVQLAASLHQSLLEVNGGLDRGIRRARFMGVLRGQSRPAVLLEGGYLSNLDEAGRIADPDFRQSLAVAVATALNSNP